MFNKKDYLILKSENFGLVKNFLVPLGEDNFKIKTYGEKVKGASFYILLAFLVFSTILAFLYPTSGVLSNEVNLFLLFNLFLVAPIACFRINK